MGREGALVTQLCILCVSDFILFFVPLIMTSTHLGHI